MSEEFGVGICLSQSLVRSNAEREDAAEGLHNTHESTQGHFGERSGGGSGGSVILVTFSGDREHHPSLEEQLF